MDYGWILISHDTYESPFMASNLGSSWLIHVPHPPISHRPTAEANISAASLASLPNLGFVRMGKSEPPSENSRKIRSEWSEWLYSYITYIYMYLVGGWPTPSGKYNARKWSDHLHCSENAAIAVRAGLDSALWWSAHPLIQPDVIDARPVMIWTLPLTCLSFSELPIMTLDQSTCRIFRPHLSCASCSRV